MVFHLALELRKRDYCDLPKNFYTALGYLIMSLLSITSVPKLESVYTNRCDRRKLMGNDPFITGILYIDSTSFIPILSCTAITQKCIKNSSILRSAIPSSVHSQA